MLRFSGRLVLLAASNALALYFSSRYIPGIQLVGETKEIIIFSFVLALINYFLKPLIEFILKPFIWLTLGILSLIINIVILKVSLYYFPIIILAGTTPLILLTIIISLANTLFAFFYKNK